MPPEREPKYPKYEWLGRDARRVRVRMKIAEANAHLARSQHVASELERMREGAGDRRMTEPSVVSPLAGIPDASTDTQEGGKA